MYFGTDLLATWGLNLQLGVAGVANFAYIAVVAAGAYIYSVLTLGPSTGNGGFQSYILGARLPIVVALLASMLGAGLLGCLIGVTGLRRLRQDYQAMIMLVVSIMAVTIIGADAAIFNGNAGLSLITNPLSSVGQPLRDWMYVVLVFGCCAVGYVFLRRFTKGPMGRALRAMRDDEDGAMAIGKNIVGLRLMVQGVGGAFAGLSGALLVGFIGAWAPSTWQYVETLALLTAIIVGGIGNDGGVVVGTALVPVLILQGVQFLPTIANKPGLVEDFGWMILGILTIVFIFFRPQGIVPERRPKFPGLAAGGSFATYGLRAVGDETDAAAPRPTYDAGSASSRAGADPDDLAPLAPLRITRVEGLLDRSAQDGAPAVTGGDILVVRDLIRHFGGVQAVDGASLAVRRGTVTGLIGPNGAGKSTVLGLVSGFIPPGSGSIEFDGQDVTKEQAYVRARHGLVRTFQLPHEFRRLTTLENLLVSVPGQRGERALATLIGRRYWKDEEKVLLERAKQLLEMFSMSDKANELARQLSGGQKRMLEFMRALMARPKLILLDEPMAGLSPMLSDRLELVINELRRDGLSVLFIEHELGAVERLCDHVIVMARGKVLAEGTMAELRSDKLVQDAYVVG